MKLEPTYVTKYMFSVRYIKNIFFMFKVREYFKSPVKIESIGIPFKPFEKEITDGELIRLTPSINQEMNQ